MRHRRLLRRPVRLAADALTRYIDTQAQTDSTATLSRAFCRAMNEFGNALADFDAAKKFPTTVSFRSYPTKPSRSGLT
jgi:hypothetical protein